MRLQKRNLQSIYYCLFEGKNPVLDDDGYETGEFTNGYSTVKMLKCSVSTASGQVQSETFGSLEGYDKVIITDDMQCPIDEHTILFVDKMPINNDSDGYDYIVKRVAKSLNHIAYAVKKVDVS